MLLGDNPEDWEHLIFAKSSLFFVVVLSPIAYCIAREQGQHYKFKTEMLPEDFCHKSGFSPNLFTKMEEKSFLSPHLLCLKLGAQNYSKFESG